jgi:hypothetical protein
VVTLTAPLRLSLEDVAAVLFTIGCIDDEDLTDDAVVRYLVADTVINAGSYGVEELRCQLGERTLNTDETAYLAYCRQRAAEVFTVCPEQRSSTEARVLAQAWREVADAADGHWTPEPAHRPELAKAR